MSEGLLRFARLALQSIEREHPYHLLHVVARPGDVAEPRALYPVFHGAFDWHSAVHGHWCLARAARCAGDADFAREVVRVLARRLTAEALAGERAYLADPAHSGFERPYGLAWLLQLAAELREWNEPGLAAATASLAPLASIAVDRLTTWLVRLPFPVRSGEHAQSAFALGLALDWARATGARDFAATIERESVRLHGNDRRAALHLEPSGHDFLSPSLGAADLMRRVLDRDAFTTWLQGFLPGGEPLAGFEPVVSPDLADGKLSHLAGLNLSRAWMLEGIADAIDPGSPAHGAFASSAARHREAGLAAVGDGPYAATHWLGSFAVYLVTRRGIPA